MKKQNLTIQEQLELKSFLSKLKKPPIDDFKSFIKSKPSKTEVEQYLRKIEEDIKRDKKKTND